MPSWCLSRCIIGCSLLVAVCPVLKMGAVPGAHAPKVHEPCGTVVLSAVSSQMQAAAQPQQMFPADPGAPPCPGTTLQPLTNLSVTARLAPNCQQSFVVTRAALQGTPCDYSRTSSDR
jgi:hypothetical protein